MIRVNGGDGAARATKLSRSLAVPCGWMQAASPLRVGTNGGCDRYVSAQMRDQSPLSLPKRCITRFLNGTILIQEKGLTCIAWPEPVSGSKL